MTTIGNVRFVNNYAPCSGFDERRINRRKKWDKVILETLKRENQNDKNLIWVGDMNVARSDSDFDPTMRGNPELQHHTTDQRPGCTDWEREGFERAIKSK